jgi:phytanoyl-CoA hydroxylase
MNTAAAEAPSVTVSADDIAALRTNGFVRIRGVLTPAEVERYRAAALEESANPKRPPHSTGGVFQQLVNVWQVNPVMRELTLLPKLAKVMRTLAGTPQRIWHDHLLIKQPHNGVATEYHQDQPYWPITREVNALSAWIALVDVPEERGCMSFIPGSHLVRNLGAQNLADAGDFLGKCPDLVYAERTTVPLRAGDITVHTGFTAHRAQPNNTDVPRVAHVVIFFEHDARYTGVPHCVTDGQGIAVGGLLPDELCPPAER